MGAHHTLPCSPTFRSPVEPPTMNSPDLRDTAAVVNGNSTHFLLLAPCVNGDWKSGVKEVGVASLGNAAPSASAPSTVVGVGKSIRSDGAWANAEHPTRQHNSGLTNRTIDFSR